MKNTSLFLLLIVFLACEKEEKENTSFGLEYSSNVTINPTSSTGVPINRYSESLETGTAERYENENTSAESIRFIQADNLTISVVSPPTVNFSFAQSIELFIDASELPEKSIGRIDNLSDQASISVELNISSDDLQEYLNGELISYRLKIINEEPIAQSIEINISTSYNVEAEIVRE